MPVPFRAAATAAALAMAFAAPLARAQTWALDANGNWNADANWSAAPFPNGVGAAAALGNVITANRTITLGQDITLGTLAIDDNNNYLVTGNALNFAAGAGSGALTVSNVNGNGAHAVASAIGLGSGLVVTQGSTGNLTLSGAISGAGGLVKRGSGTALLTAANSYAGATSIEAGILGYNVGGAIPAASAVTVGDGVGAAASAQLVVNVSMSGANALAVALASDGAVVQGNNRLVRLSAISGSGEMRINSAVGQLFEITGTGGDTTLSGLVTGGIATASFDPGAGSRMAKSGSSTLTLSGANTFVARLFITGGAVRAASASALGTSSAGTSNATFVSGAGALELDAGVSVAERVYLNGFGGGAGALRSVSGSNTVTGNVTLGWSGGSVVAVPVAIGAAAGSTLTLSGVVDGSQPLTKVGDGTVVLSGLNTWAGGTTVEAGTLRLAVADALPNAAPLAVNGGTLDLSGFSRTVASLSGTGGAIALGAGTLTVNQAGTTSFAGAIDGAGALVKSGAGTLTLTGANTYSGGTTVSAGTLAGNTAGLQGAIANATAVVFEQAGDGAFTGSISGAGTVAKRGAGNVVIAGPQTYAGATTVEAGTLTVNGALVSAASVASGATLAGTGSVGPVTTAAGAIVAPGSAAAPYGVLTVNGPYAHAAGATLRVAVDAAGQASRLAVNGVATLSGGIVDARAAAGSYNRATTYTILDAAGGVTGSFAGVAVDAAFLDPALEYDPQRVRLVLTRNSVPFTDVALTPNQRAVATALDNAAGAGATGDMGTVLSAVANLSAPAARAAYESMGGLVYTLLPTLGVSDATQFLRTTARRLARLGADAMPAKVADAGAFASEGVSRDTLPAYAQAGPMLLDQSGRSVWASAYGLTGSMDGDASGGDYDNRVGGIVIGADTRAGDRWIVGGAAGYGRWRVTNDGRGDRADADAYRLGGYARYADGPLRVDAALGVARIEYDTARRIAFGTIDRTATSDHAATQWSARVDAGYAIAWRAYTFEPYADFTWVRERADGFEERGGGSVDLAVAARTDDSTRAGTGVRLRRGFALASAPAVAEARVGYARELSGIPRIDASLVGDPTRSAMSIVAESRDRDSALFGIGVEAAPRRNLSVRVDANAELRGDFSAYSLVGALRYAW